jgi:predicted CXXCH cytochrome family protein
LGETLVAEIRGEDGRFSRKEIDLPFLAGLPEVKDSGMAPVITDLRVLSVNRGVFLSVAIGWKTDSLANALVRYGEKELSQSSDSTKRVGRNHKVVLYDLKPGRIYRFTAVSDDLFGRRRESESLTFSTSKPFTDAQQETTGKPPGSNDEIGLSNRFQRLGSAYLVELTLEGPCTVLIGSRGEARPQPTANEGSIGKREEEASHSGLSSEIVVSLAACRTCHQKQNTATHPVNVFPKPGMTIPPEYPTLPDGRITCASCHLTHSSDYEYLARKRGKRELCVGCHRDML